MLRRLRGALEALTAQGSAGSRPDSALVTTEETTMAIYALWYGGPNYSPGYVDDDTEVFDDIAAAESALFLRSVNFNGSTPCVEDSEMHVWLTDPRGVSDPYPDFIITLTDDGDAITVPA